MQPKIYIDTNIISRLADLRFKSSTAAAYAALAELPDLQWVTSEKARDEILGARDEKRRAALQFFWMTGLAWIFALATYQGLQLMGVA